MSNEGFVQSGPRTPGATTRPGEDAADEPAAIVTLSPEAQRTVDAAEEAKAVAREAREAEENQGLLSPDEEKAVLDLALRDNEVRAHELAHQAAAGGLAGGAAFTYQTGPDGRQYAVGGEVSVDMSTGNSPAETISKAQAIRAAALAPAGPSSQDLAVAAAAQQMEAEARAELGKEALAALEAGGAEGERAGSRADAQPANGRENNDNGLPRDPREARREDELRPLGTGATDERDQPSAGFVQRARNAYEAAAK